MQRSHVRGKEHRKVGGRVETLGEPGRTRKSRPLEAGIEEEMWSGTILSAGHYLSRVLYYKRVETANKQQLRENWGGRANAELRYKKKTVAGV